MQLLAQDDFRGGVAAPFGLARVATRIARHRVEGGTCLLLDNGDLLQGGLLDDHPTANPHAPHPAIACLNHLHYDAATLGNHDFSLGLRDLGRVLGQARHPTVLANAATPRQRPPFAPWTRLTRQLTCSDGHPRALQIGIIGFLPPQTPQWEAVLAGRLTCTDMLEAAARHLPAMRAAGCQLIVALCHGGIRPGPHQPGAENAAAALAGLDIDVVVAGHTHQTFPGPDIAPAPDIDPQTGTLSGKPAVMAGFRGSHLGVIDLTLAPDGAGWRIARATSRAEPCATAPPCPALTRLVAPAHHAARRQRARRIATSTVPLTSHFAQLGHDAGLTLIAQASRWHLRKMRARQMQGLPIVTAVAPCRSGGRVGPGHYTDIPAGPVSRQDLAALYLFSNHLAALSVTGADLRDWLERAAGQFIHLPPGTRGAPLLNPHFPAYNFEVIAGLTWQFDLAAPPLYDPEGRALQDGPGRVGNLRHRGRTVAPDQPFILATNSFRLGAHGLFAPITARAQPLLTRGPRLRDLLAQYLRRRRQVAPEAALGWGFAPVAEACALFPTAPGAQPPAALPMAPAGRDGMGFALWQLDLDAMPCIPSSPALSGA